MTIALFTTLLPAKIFATTVGSSGSTVKILDADKEFSEKFREGRDLIYREEWAQAAKKFNEIVVQFPDNKSADAALYWLAFCYKKQKMFKETEATLDRLLEKFPASSWANDAYVMKLEIAAPLGKWNSSNVAVGGGNSNLPAGVITSTLPAKTANGAVITTNPAASLFGKINGTTPETPLDREDEIKIAAFQSLLSADAKRGIDAMSEMLRPDSKASETLKIEVLRALRRPLIAVNSATQPVTLRTNVISLSKENIPPVREIMIRSLKEEKSAKVRREIIYTLANLRDAQSVEYLARLYESETDRELKKVIINGFGSFAGISGFSIARVSETNPGQNPNIVISKGKTPAKDAEFGLLMEIVKTEKDVELRSLALTNIQRFEDWGTDAKIVETLIQIYDSETNPDFKKTIIQSFGKIGQVTVLRKLFDIAKNDRSNELRLEAIYALRNSKDPQALKFLEELLK